MSETVLNQRYRLDEQIGEGGMAVVYRGQDLLLNRQVAVKILRPQYAADAGFLKRFDREAQAAAGFSHPNIVNVYDVGADRNQHFIVMEYIRGPSLKELIRRQGPFSVDGAIYIIGQVASALEYAHQRDLIHRDIKPQNILVDREGNAKVVDFGIAKGIRDASLTDAGTGMGTVHYVSPEQAKGEPATPASDLYSTGVVLFEMLTKRLPFEADTPIGVAMLHVNQSPPSPRQLNPAIPAQVESIILRTLSKSPADRYLGAGAFANALRHWDAPEDIRVDTSALPLPDVPPARREPVVIRPQPPPTHERRPPGGVVAKGGGGGGDRRRPPLREASARDDVGCATWLIGSAILVAIIGLVVLAFRVVPGLLGDGAAEDRATRQSLPTPTQAVATPTVVIVPTATQAAVVPTIGPAPTGTSAQTPPGPTEATSFPTIPELVGSNVAQADSLLNGRWPMLIIEEFSDSFAPGLIVSQSPTAGEELAEGEPVTVFVSIGPLSISIPVVEGLSLDDAITEIVAAGFDFATSEEPSVDVAEGVVVRTDPVDFAEPGSTITIVVSLGDVVLVPDVRGLDTETATAELNAAGILVGDVFVSGCDAIVGLDPAFDCETFPDGGVAIMSATPFLYVSRGTVVDLVIYAAEL